MEPNVEVEIPTDEQFLRFGSCLKEERQKRGLSARVVAEKVGVATETLFRWESGQMPSAHNLWRWCRALDIDFSQFMRKAFEQDAVPNTWTGRLLHLCNEVERQVQEFDIRRWGETLPTGKLGLVLMGVRGLAAAAKTLERILIEPDEGDVRDRAWWPKPAEVAEGLMPESAAVSSRPDPIPASSEPQQKGRLVSWWIEMLPEAERPVPECCGRVVFEIAYDLEGVALVARPFFYFGKNAEDSSAVWFWNGDLASPMLRPAMQWVNDNVGVRLHVALIDGKLYPQKGNTVALVGSRMG